MAATFVIVDQNLAGARGLEPALTRLLELLRVRWSDVAHDAPQTVDEVLRSARPRHFGPKTNELRRLCSVHRLLSTRSNEAPAVGAIDYVRPDFQVPPPPSRELTAMQLEKATRERAADKLVASISPAAEARMLGFEANEWPMVPAAKRQELRRRHLASFSAGQLDACRRAIVRLRKWLQENCLGSLAEDLRVSGGVMSWFVTDVQATSRASGESIPNSLRSGLTFAASHLNLPLQVKHDSFVVIAAPGSAAPKGALSATVAVMYHLERLVRHQSAVISYYASGLLLCCLAALRVRDAQRAEVSFVDGRVQGRCYTSKHPKRRTPKEMKFYTPRHLPFGCHTWASPLAARQGTFDYIFPRVGKPRGVVLTDPRVTFLQGPASSSCVIKMLRLLLTLPPLSLTEEEAKGFSGHSMRHCLPSLARALGVPREDRDELGRWLARLDSRQGGVGASTSLSNTYSDEAAPQRVIGIIERVLAAAHRAVEQRGGISQFPAKGGWDLFRPEHLSEPLQLHAPLEHEDSSSGTELCSSDDEGTVSV